MDCNPMRHVVAARGRGLPTAIANESGMALLFTLLLLATLAVLTLHLHKKTAADQLTAHVFAEQLRLRAMAEGAVRIGSAILGVPGGGDGADTLLDPWAEFKSEHLAKLFVDGVAEVAIVDLSGRLQINSLVEEGSLQGRSGRSPTVRERQARQVLLRLLSGGDFAVAGEAEARQVVDALVDWLDADDRPSEWGAESSYYQGLDPPYGCRNGPLRSVEELLLVKGISRELLFGTPTSKPLADYVTVYGSDGRINLNTAPPALLQALHADIDADLLGRLDAFRRDRRHRSFLGDPAWYENIGGWPEDIVLYEDLLTTRSTFFQVTATARKGAFEKSASVVVERVGKSQLRKRWQKIH